MVAQRDGGFLLHQSITVDTPRRSINTAVMAQQVGVRGSKFFVLQLSLLLIAGCANVPPSNAPIHQTYSSSQSADLANAKPGNKAQTRLRPREGLQSNTASLALVIGIEKYRSGLPPATGSESDAKLFAEFAEKTLRIPPRKIQTLLGNEATKSSIDATISEWVTRNAESTGDVYFYFSGHGTPSMDRHSSERYLVPWDAQPDTLASQAIAVSRLLTTLSKVKAAHVYVFLDACFTGEGPRSTLPPGAKPIVAESIPSITPPLPPPTATKSTPVVVLSATGPNEFTTTMPTGSGVFSHFLFLGLRGEADADRDGHVSLGELIDFTTAQVETEARLHSRTQHPIALGATNSLRSISLVTLGAELTTPENQAENGAATLKDGNAAGPTVPKQQGDQVRTSPNSSLAPKVLLGGGVALMLTGASVFAWSYADVSKADEYRSLEKTHPTLALQTEYSQKKSEAIDAANTKQLVGGILFGTGVIAGALGWYLWDSTRPSVPVSQRSAFFFDVYASGAAGGAQFHGRW